MGTLTFLKHPYSKIILGIIWGFGLSCIFAKTCHDGKCVIYKAPKVKDVEGKIFGKDNKCYQYTAIQTQCPLKQIEV